MDVFQKRLLIGLAVMALLVPLGIILPEKLGAGGAWGEWSAEALQSMLGYLPEGLSRYTGMWNATVSDYEFSTGSKPLSYILSGLIGAALVGLAVYLISRVAVKRGK
ncbi:MAG: cobalamin biosynthesis protein [Nitrospirae bacterium]|nr:cobalamin biosynthesis protein [Nitrospirota bacterium]